METITSYLPELIAFNQVAKSGGFTQAADKLGLSKAQLSKQVARLEMILKVQLFIRTTRSLKLTDEGRALLQYVESIIRLTEDAGLAMKKLVNEDVGIIRITAPSSFGDWLAPRMIPELKEKFPDLKIEVDFNNVKRNLVDDGYDFAIRAMEETNPDLIAKYMGYLKDVIVASPDFLKKNKVKGDPFVLKDFSCLMSSHSKKTDVWKLHKGKRDLVIDVEGNYAATSHTTLRLLCLEGLGLAKLPLCMVKNDIEAGRLIELFEDYSISTYPLYLVYPTKSYRTKKQKLIKDYLWNWLKSQKDVFI